MTSARPYKSAFCKGSSGYNYSCGSRARKNVLSREEFMRIRSDAVPLGEQQLSDMWKHVWQRPDEHEPSVQIGPESVYEPETLDLKPRLKSSDEAEKEMAAVREKAARMQKEQQDEIRRLNTLILEAKCLAVRETQVKEKKEQQRREKMQKLELELRVENEQHRIDQEREAAKAKKRAETLKYAEEIKQQMAYQRRLKQEAKEKLRNWEADNLEKKIQAHRTDKEIENERRLRMQNNFKENLKYCVEAKREQQQRLQEKEQSFCVKLQEQNILRAEMEAQVKVEREKQRLEIEERKMKARELWETNRQRLIDEQIKSEAKRLERLEVLDRDWRKRELNKAEAASEARRKLQEEWALQIQEKARIKEEKKRREMEKDQAIIRADMTKLEEEEKRKREQRAEQLVRMQELQEHMNHNARERGKYQSGRKAEADEAEKRQKMYDDTVNEMRQKKLSELRSANVPEKHIRNIDRRSRVDCTLRHQTARVAK